MLGNGSQVLGNGNGLLVLGNGLHLLGIMLLFGILSHSVLCCIQHYVVRYNVTFGIMSHSDFVRHCVIRPTFGVCIDT